MIKTMDNTRMYVSYVHPSFCHSEALKCIAKIFLYYIDNFMC